MSQLSTWSERHSLMKKSHPFCKTLLQVIEFSLDGCVVTLTSTIVSLLIKSLKKRALLLFLLLHTCQTLLLFIQKALTIRLLSRGIYLHYTLQGRHIFISSKAIFAYAMPINLQVCQPCQLIPST